MIAARRTDPTMPIPAPLRALAVILLAGLVLFSRRPDAFLHPQFWAEDGAIFFAQQYTLGLAAFAEPYAGYLHLLPRLVAEIAHQLAGPAWAPAIYNLGAALITLLAAASLIDERLPLPARPALALAVVLVPHAAHEVFLTITNVQWVTALALLATLCKEAPDPAAPAFRRQWAGDVTVVVLCGLTGPFAVLFTPLYALRVFRSPSAHGKAMLVLLLVVSLLQAQALLQRPPGAGQLAMSAPVVAEVLGRRLFEGLFVPVDVAGVPASAWFAAYVSLLAFLAWQLRARRTVVAMLLGGHAVVVAASLVKLHEVATPLPLMHLPFGLRYFYIPQVILLWLLLTVAADRRGVARVLALLLLAGALATAVVRDWQALPAPDRQWARWSEQIGQRAVSIPINPEPWTVELPARR